MNPSSIQDLSDIEALKQLKARYFRFLDTKQWNDWGQVFTADAVMETPEAGLVTHGRDEIVTMVSTALTGARTVHHGHMPELELADPDSARGIWAMEDYVEWPENDGQRVGLRGYGHYREEYRREADGQWRISSLRLERLRVDSLA